MKNRKPEFSAQGTLGTAIYRMELITALVLSFSAMMAVTIAASEPLNLLPLTFEELNDDKLPVGYQIGTFGENPAAASVSTERDETGATVVKVDITREASVRLETVRRTRLDTDGEYFFVVQIEVENMRYTGDWYKRPAGIRAWIYCMYGGEDKGTFLAVWGDGSSKGWLTGILPFPKKNAKENSANVNVLLDCNNMTGTVRFRNPMILKKPDGIDIRRSFEMEDGAWVFSSNLQVRP